MANAKETSIAVSYDIAFDFETLESDDVMDKRYGRAIPFICGSNFSKIIVIDTILVAICITSGIAHVGAWSVDKILYAGDTKKWQSCLERLSTSFRALDGLAMLKLPVHTFLDTHKLTPTIKLNSVHENIYRAAREKHVLTPKFKLEFSIKGLEIRNIGGDGLVTFRAKGVVRNIDIDLDHDFILKAWKKESHQSLTNLCEGKTDELIKQQINGLIESLLNQMSKNLPRMNLWEKVVVYEKALQSNSDPIAP